MLLILKQECLLCNVLVYCVYFVFEEEEDSAGHQRSLKFCWKKYEKDLPLLSYVFATSPVLKFKESGKHKKYSQIRIILMHSAAGLPIFFFFETANPRRFLKLLRHYRNYSHFRNPSFSEEVRNAIPQVLNF